MARVEVIVQPFPIRRGDNRQEVCMPNLRDRLLDTGDPFPAVTVRLIDGREGTLPDMVGPGYGVVLWYRGDW